MVFSYTVLIDYELHKALTTDQNTSQSDSVESTSIDDTPVGQSLSDDVDHTHKVSNNALDQEPTRSYKELRQRAHRCRELGRIARKMAQQKNLMVKKNTCLRSRPNHCHSFIRQRGDL